MAVKNFSAGAVLTASDTNTYLANSGLVYVASKTWTSTGAAQQIDNCFTSTYDNYRIIVQTVGNQGTPTPLVMRLVDGTTPDTASNYYYAEMTTTVTATFGGYWSGAVGYGASGFVADNHSLSTIDLASPNLATYSSWVSDSWSSGTANIKMGNVNGSKLTTTQYEGIQFYPAAGTWSGTITVYGYRKA